MGGMSTPEHVGCQAGGEIEKIKTKTTSFLLGNILVTKTFLLSSIMSI